VASCGYKPFLIIVTIFIIGKKKISGGIIECGSGADEETEGEKNDGKFDKLNVVSFQFCYI